MAVCGRLRCWPWLRGALLALLCFSVTTITITRTTEESDANALKINQLKTASGGQLEERIGGHVALRRFQLLNEGAAKLADNDTISGRPQRGAVLALSPVGALRRVPRASTYLSWPSKQLRRWFNDEKQFDLGRPSNAAAQVTRDGRQVIEQQLHNNIHKHNHNNNNNAQLLPSIRPNRSADLSYELRGEDSQKRLMELKQKYMTNRAISDTSYYMLLGVYSLFILIGAISNSLICLTLILKPKILSPRNIFIFNLAGSDLLLCVFTMPFSFIEMSMKMWQLGTATCKLVAGLQATSIYVSTISITAIALDRHKVIVNPTHQETPGSAKTAAFLLASIWFGALLLSTPLFTFRTVQNFNQRNISTTEKFEQSIRSINFCIEKWPFEHGRGIYSVISMIFQYVVPITIVSVAYASINQKLKKRLRSRQRLTQLSQQKRQSNLINKTHSLLIYASVIFGCSWLPLNLLNVIGDFSDIFSGDGQKFRIVFAICHLIGCSSACSNPILYGYYNKNFRKEFHQVYTHHMHIIMRKLRRFCCLFEPDNNGASLPPSNSSGDGDDSMDMSSYESRSDNQTDLIYDADEPDLSDDNTTELTSTSSLNRRLCAINSSVSASAIAEQAAIQQSSSVQLAGNKMAMMMLNNNKNTTEGPTSALEMITSAAFNNRHRASAGQVNCNSQHLNADCNSLQQQLQNRNGTTLKRTSYVTDNSLNNSGSHHYSFQTITSSRYSFAGRAVRFCLCFSGADSSETVGGTITPMEALKRKPCTLRPNQLSVSPNPSSHRVISKTSPIQQHQQQDQYLQQHQHQRCRLQSLNEPTEVLAAKTKQRRLRAIRRRRRLVRRYRNFVNGRCECHCHSHAPTEGGFVRRRISQLLLGNEFSRSRFIGDRSTSTAASCSEKAAQSKGAEGETRQTSSQLDLVHRTAIDRIARTRFGRGRAASSGSASASASAMIKMNTMQRFCDKNNNEPISSGEPAAAAAHGRRVWLRFFPAIERYYNEPTGLIQVCEPQQQQQQQQQSKAIATKQSANNAVCEQANNLIVATKVESDRHLENKSRSSQEMATSQAGDLKFAGWRAELSLGQQEGRTTSNEKVMMRGGAQKQQQQQQQHQQQDMNTRNRHCVICRRKVAAEYRKLVDASRANRARKKARINAAAAASMAAAAKAKAGQPTGNSAAEQKASVRPRKEVALETKAKSLAPPIGVELLSVVLPSAERSTSELSGLERSTSVVILNVTDLEASTQPVGGEAPCEQNDNDREEGTNLGSDGSHWHTSGKRETLTGPATSSLVINGSARKENKYDHDNNISTANEQASFGMQISRASSDCDGGGLLVRQRSVHSVDYLRASGPPNDQVEFAGEITDSTKRDDVICSTKGRQPDLENDIRHEYEQAKAEAKTKTNITTTTTTQLVVGEFDRKRMSMVSQATGRSDLIKTGLKQSLDWKDTGSSSRFVENAAHLQAATRSVGTRRDNNKKISSDERQCQLAGCAAPIMQASDQQSHASSGSSLCACVQARSSSCSCSGGSDSSSLGSSSLPHSTSSRTNNYSASNSSASASASGSTSTSSSSSSAASSAAVSATSLTSSQPQVDQRIADEGTDLAIGQQHQHQARAYGQRTISSSFSTATAPWRPRDITKSALAPANSVLQLSAPTTCQPSTAGSSCSISTGAPCAVIAGSTGELASAIQCASSTVSRTMATTTANPSFSSSSSLEVATRVVIMTAAATNSNSKLSPSSSSNCSAQNATQISHLGHPNNKDEPSQQRKLSAASCGSPTSRQLATINELSFRQQDSTPSMANGLPVRH